MIARRTMTVSLIWPFQRAYERLGVPSERLLHELRELGLGPAQLADPAARVPFELALGRVSRYAELLGRPDIGLLAGDAVLPGDFGPLELAARSCATPREALRVLANGYSVLADGVHIALEERADRMTLRFWSDAGFALPPPAVEFALLSLFRVGTSYVDAALTPIAVRFAHAAVPYALRCEEAFGSPVAFGRDEHALDLPGAMFDAPLRTASLTAARLLTARVDELASSVDSPSVVARVDAHVTARLSTGLPTVGDVAHALGMSERSLHRRLEEAGASYRGVCDAVRRRCAQHYLSETDLTIKEIAAHLAYSDVQAFHRAFKRLTGYTPQQFRQRAVRRTVS
jgi:AraC-like DNA-binding protein